MIKIKNLNGKAEIYIYGVIIDDTDASWMIRDGDGTIGYQFPAEIKKQLDSLKSLPIDVHIASDGGDIAAGIAIFNMLKSHDADVTVYIDSWAASIASVIAFAGKTIVMPENTFLMIHNPRGGGFGESDFLRSIADWLDKLRDMIAETYAKRMVNFDENSSLEEIKSKMDAETWFSAKECAEMFKNVKLVESNEIEAVASLHSDYSSAPDSVKNVKNVKKNIDDDIKKSIINQLIRSYGNEEES